MATLRQAHRFPTVIPLILANAAPIVGVLFFGWDLLSIMFLYWMETAVVAFYRLGDHVGPRAGRRVGGAGTAQDRDGPSRPPASAPRAGTGARAGGGPGASGHGVMRGRRASVYLSRTRPGAGRCCPAAAHLIMSTMTTPQTIRNVLPTAYVTV